MKLFKRIIVTTVSVLCLGACTAHNPFNLQNTTESSPPTVQLPPSTERVFITSQDLPPSVHYESISRIEVGKVGYGSSEEAYISLAERARALGANAIIEARTWHQPTGFSWAAPHGSGLAVRLKDIKDLTSPNVVGKWY